MVSHDRDWERRLYQGLCAGDDKALAAAYDDFSPYVYGIALRATGDEEAAEDITEQVFLRLWERPGKFDPERGPLRVLLCEQARSRAIRWLRQAGAQRTVSALNWEPIEAPRSDGSRSSGPRSGGSRASGSAGLGSAEPGAADGMVRDVLRNLPAHERDALMLAYLQGLSFREVATRLAIPEGTARSGIYSGLRQLAVALAAARVAPAAAATRSRGGGPAGEGDHVGGTGTVA